MPERRLPTVALLAGIALAIWVQHRLTAELGARTAAALEADRADTAEFLERAGVTSNGTAVLVDQAEAAAGDPPRG
jgi:hypothetical protein